MLTVIKQVKNESKTDFHKKFLVRCLCGLEYVVNSQQLKKSKCCKFCSWKNVQKRGWAARKKENSIYKTDIYHVWQSMKSRCYNKNNCAYERYGGRGIKICEEWLDPFIFYTWAINNNYTHGKQIDRMDNNGDYEPNNCRWATPKEQSNNRRSNRYIFWRGKTKTMAEWAVYLGISYHALRSRVYKGWTITRAFSTKFRQVSKTHKIT